MPRTHTWNLSSTSDNFIFNPSNYLDDTSFSPGDTLVVNAGDPGIIALAGTSSYTLMPGTFLFNDTGGTNENVTFDSINLGSTSSLEFTGPQQLYWYSFNQFVNNGLVRVGSGAAPGSVYYDEVTNSTTKQSQWTNNGTFKVQNASRFQASGAISGSTLLNNAGGLISVSNGSTLDWEPFYGASNGSVINNGSIVVQGGVGNATSFIVGDNLTGSGVLSIQGAAGTASNETSATINGALNSTVDLANGNLNLIGNPTGGSVNFLNGDAALVLNGGPGLANSSYVPFGATIAGFRQGDIIQVNETLALSGYTYNTATHTLSINASNGTPQLQFVFAGNYTQGDFQVTLPQFGVGTCAITTTSTANTATTPIPPAVASLTGDADPLFDAAYYLAANPDVLAAGADPYTHFLTYGWPEGRNPSASFDVADYLAANPDVAAAHIDPLLHYEDNGQAEGRAAFAVPATPPDPLVDAATYYAANPDVAKAGIDASVHYDSVGWTEGRNPDPLFDTSYYLAQNPDVKAAGVDPLTQYEQYGWKEGRDPSLLFSTSQYLAANPDVAAAGVDPLLHYLDYGQAEGRMAFLPGATAAADPLVNASFYDQQLGATLIPAGMAGAQQAAGSYNGIGWQKGLNPDAFFNTAYYLAHNPDVAAAKVNPLLQYEQFGWHEGRNPSAQFDTNKYLAAYPDVKAAGIDPLLHYVAYGQAEGRTAFSV